MDSSGKNPSPTQNREKFTIVRRIQDFHPRVDWENAEVWTIYSIATLSRSLSTGIAEYQRP